ncbi:hypothetical protein D3C77_438120 [compost metagenome]
MFASLLGLLNIYIPLTPVPYYNIPGLCTGVYEAARYVCRLAVNFNDTVVAFKAFNDS